jgi:methyl-accepting chemotaxis protein
MNELRRSRRNFRIHLLLTSSFAIVAFATVIATSLFAPLVVQLGRSEASPEELAGAAHQFLFLHEGFWPVVAVSLVCAIASALLLYQRMTAPLVRFHRAYEEVSHGRLPGPLVIRATDYLQEEAAALNGMTSALRERALALESRVAAVREVVELLEGREEKLDPEAHELIDRLRARLQELESHVAAKA